MLRDTGASVRIFNLAKGLVSLGNNVELLLPSFAETCDRVQGITVRNLKGFLPRKFLKLISKLIGISRPTTLLFYDPAFIQRVCRIIQKSDVVQFEQQPAGALLIPITAKILKRPVVVDCHDTFQALRVENTRLLRKFLEKTIYKFASVILTVSEKEKLGLVSLGVNKDRIKVTPNGVDTKAFFQSVHASEIFARCKLTDSPVIVFVGNMEYLPNKEAVRLIALKLAPKVKKCVKDVKFLVVGRIDGPTYENLTYTGVVDNVARILANSDVAIAPLIHGSGSRLKILEYFCQGLPVVSTTVGVEGLDVENGVHAIIEDDMDVFSAKLIYLLKNKDLSNQLGRAARELVVSKYDWSKITCYLNGVLRGTASEFFSGTSDKLKKSRVLSLSISGEHGG
jgi:glycosyltransferase involved in cell wall biosynthesis